MNEELTPNHENRRVSQKRSETSRVYDLERFLRAVGDTLAAPRGALEKRNGCCEGSGSGRSG